MYYTDEIMNNVYDYLQEAKVYLNKANDNLISGYNNVSRKVRAVCNKREVSNGNLSENAQDIIDDFSHANEDIENLSLTTFNSSIFDSENLDTATYDEQSYYSTSSASFDDLDEEIKEAIYNVINDSGNLTDTQKELAKENEEALAYGFIIWTLETEIENLDSIDEDIAVVYGEAISLENNGNGFWNNDDLTELIETHPELEQYFQADEDGNYIYEENNERFVKDSEGNLRKLSEYLSEIQENFTSYKSGLRNQRYQYECQIKTIVYADIDMEEVQNTEYNINDTIQSVLNHLYDSDGNILMLYNSWNVTGLGDIRTGDNCGLVYSNLNFLNFMYNDEGFREFYNSNYGHYPSKQDIADFYLASSDLNNQFSLEIRCFLYMTDEQYQIYNYLYATERQEKANDYLNSIEDGINNQMGFERAKEMFINVYSNDTDFLKIMDSFGYGVENGVRGCFNNICTTFNKNATKTVDEYAAYYLCILYSCDLMTTEYSQEEFIQACESGEIEITSEVYAALCNQESISVLDIKLASGEITEDEYNMWKELSEIPEYQELFEETNGKGSKGLNLAFQVGSSVGNMLPSIAANMIISGPAGAGGNAAAKLGKLAANVILFLNSYGGNYKQNVRLGYGQSQAQLASFLSATGEVGTEFLFGKIAGVGLSTNIESVLSELTTYTSIWQFLKYTALNIAKDIGGEILQEIGQDWFDKMLRSITLGEPVDFSSIKADAIETAIVTAFTTLILNTPTNIATTVSGVYNISKTQTFVINGQSVNISQGTINAMQVDMINQGVLTVNETTGLLEISDQNKLYSYVKSNPTASIFINSTVDVDRLQATNIIETINSTEGEGKGTEILAECIANDDFSVLSKYSFDETSIPSVESISYVLEVYSKEGIANVITDLSSSYLVSAEYLKQLFQKYNVTNLSDQIAIFSQKLYFKTDDIQNFIVETLSSALDSKSFGSLYQINDSLVIDLMQAGFDTKLSIDEKIGILSNLNNRDIIFDLVYYSSDLELKKWYLSSNELSEVSKCVILSNLSETDLSIVLGSDVDISNMIEKINKLQSKLDDSFSNANVNGFYSYGMDQGFIKNIFEGYTKFRFATEKLYEFTKENGTFYRQFYDFLKARGNSDEKITNFLNAYNSDIYLKKIIPAGALDIFNIFFEYYNTKYIQGETGFEMNLDYSNAILDVAGEIRDSMYDFLQFKKNVSPKTADIILKSMDQKMGICTYASTVNNIFFKFLGDENGFYDHFGYDMYFEKNGFKIFNPQLLVDLYYDVLSKSNPEIFATNNDGKTIIQESCYTDGIIERNFVVGLESIVKLKTNEINSFLREHNLEISDYQIIYTGCLNKSLIKNIISSSLIKGDPVRLALDKGCEIKNVSTQKTMSLGEGHSVVVTGFNEEGILVSSWGLLCNVSWSQVKKNNNNLKILKINEIEVINND